jgi:hypothetical protein
VCCDNDNNHQENRDILFTLHLLRNEKKVCLNTSSIEVSIYEPTKWPIKSEEA